MGGCKPRRRSKSRRVQSSAVRLSHDNDLSYEAIRSIISSGHERSGRVGGKLSTASISSIEEELDVAEDFELPDLDDEEEPWDKDVSDLFIDSSSH